MSSKEVSKKRKTRSHKTATKNSNYINVMDNSLLVKFEYVKDYKAYVHAAPAFRTVSARKVREITQRLTRQTHRIERPKSETLSTTENGKQITADERRYRLFLLTQPTISSSVRKYFCVKEWTTGNNNMIQCDRFNKTASERYRQMYQHSYLY